MRTPAKVWFDVENVLGEVVQGSAYDLVSALKELPNSDDIFKTIVSVLTDAERVGCCHRYADERLEEYMRMIMKGTFDPLQDLAAAAFEQLFWLRVANAVNMWINVA